VAADYRRVLFRPIHNDRTGELEVEALAVASIAPPDDLVDKAAIGLVTTALGADYAAGLAL
jgi:hypothetical protein